MTVLMPVCQNKELEGNPLVWLQRCVGLHFIFLHECFIACEQVCKYIFKIVWDHITVNIFHFTCFHKRTGEKLACCESKLYVKSIEL